MRFDNLIQILSKKEETIDLTIKYKYPMKFSYRWTLKKKLQDKNKYWNIITNNERNYS